jgi:hypothetical protein
MVFEDVSRMLNPDALTCAHPSWETVFSTAGEHIARCTACRTFSASQWTHRRVPD